MEIMRGKQCANGHFFDAEKYQFCPTCGAGLKDGSNAESEKRQSLFGWLKRKENGSTMQPKTGRPDVNAGAVKDVLTTAVGMDRDAAYTNIEKTESLNIERTESLNRVEAKSAQEKMKETVGLFKKDSQVPPVTNQQDDRTFGMMIDNRPLYREEIKQDEQPVSKQEEQPVSKPEELPVSKPEELYVTGNSASEQTTGAFFSKPIRNDLPTPAPQVKRVSKPCVGWLVCIQGMLFGQSFEIYEGRNSVGRNDTNMVVLSGDTSVSREKHLWIVFDYKKSEFFLSPGEGSGTAYLNDELLMTPVKLNSQDVIEIGAGKYLFIPLCGEDFSWEKYQ